MDKDLELILDHIDKNHALTGLQHAADRIREQHSKNESINKKIVEKVSKMENEKRLDQKGERIKNILNAYRVKSVKIDIDHTAQHVEMVLQRTGFCPQTFSFDKLKKAIDFIMQTSQHIDSIEQDIDYFIREAKNEIY